MAKATVTPTRLTPLGVEDFPESMLLSITAVSAGESCGLCRQPVPAGLAAKDADGWLVCAECACRVPSAAMAT